MKTKKTGDYARALEDMLEFVIYNEGLITRATERGKLKTTFLAGATMACLLLGDAIRNGLVRDFARRMRARNRKAEARRVGHA
jgi:hypothetical protein